MGLGTQPDSLFAHQIRAPGASVIVGAYKRKAEDWERMEGASSGERAVFEERWHLESQPKSLPTSMRTGTSCRATLPTGLTSDGGTCLSSLGASPERNKSANDAAAKPLYQRHRGFTPEYRCGRPHGHLQAGRTGCPQYLATCAHRRRGTQHAVTTRTRAAAVC